MMRILRQTLLALAVAGTVVSARAFSLLGPLDPAFQTPALGYGLGRDIGGPMNLGEEYRWNIKTIYYGFDESFFNYFGQQGKAEVEKAIAILNNLPSTSQMSSNLSEFPTDTRRVNFQASALGLYDMKSITLGFLLEEMGLASPERFAWTLRSRTATATSTNYLVIKRNFDPVTLVPSSYVNGTLYTYSVVEGANGANSAEAVEVPVDPLAFTFTAVVSLNETLSPGQFYTGLSRDDAGGLRYLYRQNNYNVENLIPNSTGSGGGGGGEPWTPIGGPGATNPAVTIALRPGVQKITYRPVEYDSLLGVFTTLTNTYTDTYVTNSSLVNQSVQRVLLQPDILFSAQDFGAPLPIIQRQQAVAPFYLNNDALNGQATLAGPGQIQPQLIFIYNKLGPSFDNSWPFFLSEANQTPSVWWGSFDGTTNAPILYPIGSSIQELEQQVLGN